MSDAVDLEELERYLRLYQENPESRIFAPLADMYRRLGRYQDALEISKEGIHRHPYYAGGRVAFAHVLHDMEDFENALTESEYVVTYYPDNLLARKILIRTLAALALPDRASREYDVLKSMSPEAAADPLLARALAGDYGQQALMRVKGQQIQSNRIYSLRKKQRIINSLMLRLKA